MSSIQKSTYTDLISTSVYTENAFLARSITLDFLYSFENSYLAIFELTNALNEDRKLARLGIKCIHGIVLGVESFTLQTTAVVSTKFIDTLILAVRYKVDNPSLPEYVKCMNKILDFISKNMELQLLNAFFSLVESFVYCEWEKNGNIEVFNLYCVAVSNACRKLMKRDRRTFLYYISKFRSQYMEFENDEILKNFCEVLKQFENEKIGYIISNDKDLVNKEYGNRMIEDGYSLIECEDAIREIKENKNVKILFVINFNKSDYSYILYYLGKLKAILKENVVLKVHGMDAVNINPKIQKIVDECGGEEC